MTAITSSSFAAATRRRNRLRRAGCSLAAFTTLSLGAVVIVDAPAAAEGVASVSGLGQGARGDAVKAVQQALVNHGVAVTGGVDGIYGAGTANAVKQFQASNGLTQTGSVDDATAIALGLATTPTMGLAQGARSDAVKQLQQALINAGFSMTGGADGVFGAATTTALKAFQTSKGLSPTGTVNAATAAALGGVTATTPPATPPATPPTTPTPPATPAAPTGLVGLAIGTRGDFVKQLQQQLIGAGYALVGGADGIYGAITANAVKQFQTAKGLPVSGTADQATVDALAAAQPAAPASGGGSPTASSPLLGLALGARGDKVKQLQQTLVTAGVSVRGGVDGIFGASTQTALKQYQAAVGVAQSGTVDEATASALASGKTVNGTSSNLVGLKAGSLGTTVKQLQQALIAAGVNVRGGADGIFGPATSEALKAFQTSQGLSATGVVDDATSAALKSPKPVTPASSSSTGGFAVFGERGARVMALQSALIKAGIAVKGGVDGDFGAGTSAAIMDFQRAKGLSVTGRVNEATAAALGLTKAEAPAVPDPGSVHLEVFPVQGKCYFGDSYGASRAGGRTHLGVDIIAPAGKLIYAAVGGTITKIYADYPGSLSGNGVRITAADGSYFFYAHMTGVATGMAVGVKVKTGQIIGTVGSTGDTGTNHLHFEVHPQGGTAVNPYPLVKAIDACSVTEPRPQ